jgi:hypothetical protein
MEGSKAVVRGIVWSAATAASLSRSRKVDALTLLWARYTTARGG